MSDAKLTKEMGFSLLSRLADDDAFRARFEAAPARALVEIGVPAELVVNLKAACIERRTLASKETFEELLKQNADKSVHDAMRMIVPNVGFSRLSNTTKSEMAESTATIQRNEPRERIALH